MRGFSEMLQALLSRLVDLGELVIAVGILIAEFFFRGIVTVTFGMVSEDLLAKYFSAPGYFRKKESQLDADCDRSSSELIISRGYPCENHYVRTSDGYILGMQRIPYGSKDKKPVGGEKRRPAVFMLHGFMMCSEALLIRKKSEDSLPLVLADNGYDVWLGNIRGSKYSFKHISLKPKDPKFWDFSLDEHIAIDLPTMLEYILNETGAPKISYIGFSQGTALGFGALALHPKLASRVNLMIALASTALVRGLHNPLIDAITRARPELVFLMFGRKSFLPSTLFWRRILDRELLVRVLDLSNKFLFGWCSQKADTAEKALLYSHLYSYASVKAVVHWFQIIRTKRFQMFDDTLDAKPEGFYTGHEVPVYQLRRLSTPFAIFYGGKDNLPDVHELMKVLPDATYIHKEDDYEHLDFLWANDLRERVYPHILRLLAEHNNK